MNPKLSFFKKYKDEIINIVSRNHEDMKHLYKICSLCDLYETVINIDFQKL